MLFRSGPRPEGDASLAPGDPRAQTPQPQAGDDKKRRGAPYGGRGPGPDWAKLCEAYGVPCFRARTPEEVDTAIRAAQAVDGPAMVWFETAETQNVFPMMPAGKGLSDLIETWGEGAEEA